MIIGPDGNPEAFTWVVQYQGGELYPEIDPQGGPDRSFLSDVEHGRVRSLWLVPQRPELASHGVRIPEGCRPWFWRRREFEGRLGVTGSEQYLGTNTGIGWRDGNDYGPTVMYLDDGSSLIGIDDGTLLMPGAWDTTA